MGGVGCGVGFTITTVGKRVDGPSWLSFNAGGASGDPGAGCCEDKGGWPSSGIMMTGGASTLPSRSVAELSRQRSRSLSIAKAGTFFALNTWSNFSGKRSAIIFPTAVFECVRRQDKDGRRKAQGSAFCNPGDWVCAFVFFRFVPCERCGAVSRGTPVWTRGPPTLEPAETSCTAVA